MREFDGRQDSQSDHIIDHVGFGKAVCDDGIVEPSAVSATIHPEAYKGLLNRGNAWDDLDIHVSHSDLRETLKLTPL